MKKKLITSILILMTLGLLALVIYIGSVLRQEKSTLTTIKKTKAASLTYTKTLALNKPISVTPTEIIIAASPSLTSSPDSLSPTSTFLAANNITPLPTIGQTLSGTPSAALTKTSAKITSLPDSGRTDYLVSLVIIASIIIFFSFLY